VLQLQEERSLRPVAQHWKAYKTFKFSLNDLIERLALNHEVNVFNFLGTRLCNVFNTCPCPCPSGTELFRRVALQGRARTRQAAGGHGLAVQFARTGPRKYSFSVRAVEKWNKLLEEVRAAPRRAAFRYMIQNLWETEIQWKDGIWEWENWTVQRR
jgi:hypothetical protein